METMQDKMFPETWVLVWAWWLAHWNFTSGW